MRRITLTNDEHKLMLTMLALTIDMTTNEMHMQPGAETTATHLRAKLIQHKFETAEQLNDI